MSNIFYNQGRQNAAACAAAASGWKVMLVNGYTPDPDDTVASIAALEIADTTGYTAGFGNRLALTGLAATAQDDANDRAGIDATDLTVAAIGVALGVDVTHAILLREITDDGGSKAYSCIELNGGSVFTLNGGSLTIVFDARGFAEFA